MTFCMPKGLNESPPPQNTPPVYPALFKHFLQYLLLHKSLKGGELSNRLAVVLEDSE